MTRSNFEGRIKQKLKQANIDYDYEGEDIPFILESVYKPDFIVGSIYIEAKGYLRPTDRRKMLAVKKQHPELDIRFWFMRDNYLNPKTKATLYSQWAKKNNFPFHIGETLPIEWFKDVQHKKKKQRKTKANAKRKKSSKDKGKLLD